MKDIKPWLAKIDDDYYIMLLTVCQDNCPGLHEVLLAIMGERSPKIFKQITWVAFTLFKKGMHILCSLFFVQRIDTKSVKNDVNMLYL